MGAEASVSGADLKGTTGEQLARINHLLALAKKHQRLPSLSTLSRLLEHLGYDLVLLAKKKSSRNER